MALLGVACGPGEPDEPAPGTELETPTEDPDEPDGSDEETDLDDGSDEPTDEDPAEGSEQPAEDDGSTDPEGPDRIDGEQTAEASDEGQPGVVAVTDVRVGTHADFDRLVFEVEGDGVAGWDVRYVEEARSQGSGESIEVAGDAVLSVALRNVTLPPDLPDDIQRWDEDRIDGPEDGIIVEVVNDTIFEGMQTVFVGLDQERPFIIDRLEDPQRVVIDIPHGE